MVTVFLGDGEGRKVSFKPTKHLSLSERNRINSIKKAVTVSTNSEELRQYDKEVDRLIKKATLRKEMGREFPQ